MTNPIYTLGYKDGNKQADPRDRYANNVNYWEGYSDGEDALYQEKLDYLSKLCNENPDSDPDGEQWESVLADADYITVDNAISNVELHSGIWNAVEQFPDTQGQDRYPHVPPVVINGAAVAR